MSQMDKALRMAVFTDGRFQYEIGEQVGINEARMTRIVRGQAKPTPRERQGLARALGKREEELFES